MNALPAEPSPGDAVHAALDRFHRAFASGEPGTLAEIFAVDARLLLLHSEAIEGRAAIRQHWARLFAAWDTGASRAEPLLVAVHGDRAYTVSTYTETLVSRSGGPSRLVVGRLVLFFALEPDAAWRVTLALNSHVRPVEELERSRPD